MPLLFPPVRSSQLLVTGGVAPRPVLTLSGNAMGRRGTCLQGLGTMVSAAETQPPVTSSRAERSGWCGAYTRRLRVNSEYRLRDGGASPSGCCHLAWLRDRKAKLADQSGSN